MTDKSSKCFSHVLAGLVVVGGLVTAAGCAPPPATVHGHVTLDGKPLEEAAIMFVPLVQGRGKTGAVIVDGQYTLPLQDGLLPGKYRVEIIDNPPLDSVPHSPLGASSDKPSKRRRVLPPVYSHHSPFEIDIPSGAAKAGPIEANYELQSKP
jgi:hypothetical protein